MHNGEPGVRVRSIIRLLKKAYPDVRCELNFTSPLELLIATILSARCTDKQVNKVTQKLFVKYKNAEAYANADLRELENDLKGLGMYKTKARSIKACCQKLADQHGGQVPRDMGELLKLNGVGRKTANVVLGNAYGIASGIVVDTHVARLAQRLGLTEQTDPEKIELDLQKIVSKDDWILFSHLLIWHGRRRCKAVRPDCLNCELAHLCPSCSNKPQE